jgi:hypothetical protein
MKDRILDFHQNNDKTLVEYDTDKKKGIIKKTSDLISLAAHLRNLIDSDKLEEGFKEIGSSLLESYTTGLLKEFNYNSVLVKEKEKRIEQVRSLNIENRELRQQLGEKASAEDVRECLKSISEKINVFWDEEGFQYLKIKEFAPYGMRVIFNTSSLHSMWHGSSSGLERHIEKLKSFGFELCGDDEKKDDALLFSEANVSAFTSVLSNHFKSFKVFDVKARNFNGNLLIRDIEVYFQDFDELLNMPFNTYMDKSRGDHEKRN